MNRGPFFIYSSLQIPGMMEGNQVVYFDDFMKKNS